MYDAMERLKEKGINVYAIKTDALHIAKTDLKKARKILEFGREIGNWRVEKMRVKSSSGCYAWIKIPAYKNESIEAEEEWNTEEICKQIIRKKRVI